MRSVSSPLLFAAMVASAWGRSAWSADDDFEKSMDSQWKQIESSVTGSYATYEKSELQYWKNYQKRVAQKWADGSIPERKIYVQYFQNDATRVRVDYENGKVTVETLFDSRSKDREKVDGKLQAALSSVVVADSDARSVLSKDELALEPQAPVPLIETSMTGSDGKPRVLYRLELKLVPDFVKRRAVKFKPIVDIWASKYGLDSAYLLAIIRQESGFNPRARSWVPAIGLMQIVPHYAGQEVLKTVTGKATVPDADFLYDPAKNIMIGATYLQLLRDQYFPEVKDEAKRLYLMTASYNWGPHRIRKAIKAGRIPASASSASTFNIIQNIAPEETRTYVRKVSGFFIEFKKEGM